MTSMHYDAIVIGSGAGGATAFWELSKLGLNPLLLERGHDLSGQYVDTPVHEIVSKGTVFGSGRPYLGFPPFPFIEGQLVGGTTEINGGLFWRTPTTVFESWRDSGFLDWLTEDEIDSSWLEIEKELSVGEEVEQEGNDNDSTLLSEGFAKLGIQSTRARRATVNCRRSNRCAFGCPTGAKQSMSNTLIPRAIRLGGHIEPRANVKKLQREGDKHIVSYYKDGNLREVKTTLLFLAGGVHETPKLVVQLLEKPLITTHNIHVNIKILAKHTGAIEPGKATIFTRQVQEYLDDGVLLMPSQSGKEAFALLRASLPPILWPEFDKQKNHFGLYTLQLAALTPTIQLSTKASSHQFHRVGKDDLAKIRRYLKVLVEALHAAGFESFYLSRKKKFRNVADTLADVGKVRLAELDISSVHAMGGLALGGSIVSPYGEIRKSPGAFVTDSSILPGAVHESPQGTIMMTSLQVARRAALALRGG